jgi:hypothetical protein
MREIARRMYGQLSAIRLILELAVRIRLSFAYPADRFAQFFNSLVERTFMVLVILACMGETGYLTPESPERRDGFDINADACGWHSAGHTIG